MYIFTGSEKLIRIFRGALYSYTEVPYWTRNSKTRYFLSEMLAVLPETLFSFFVLCPIIYIKVSYPNLPVMLYYAFLVLFISSFHVIFCPNK